MMLAMMVAIGSVCQDNRRQLSRLAGCAGAAGEWVADPRWTLRFAGVVANLAAQREDRGERLARRG
jgi:hypothetical protein